MNLTHITQSHHRIAGVDEAGRGPLAGPVVVAAVMLPQSCKLDGLDDSKRLNRQQRELLFPLIQETAVSWSIIVVDVDEIEQHNILGATLIGMQRAVLALEQTPTLTLVDGGPGDDGGLLDGKILDPSGLGTASSVSPSVSGTDAVGSNTFGSGGGGGNA